MFRNTTALFTMVAMASACGPSDLGNGSSAERANESSETRSWLAGDHHIHTEWSAGWDETTNPPTPIIGGGAPYPITQNAEKALSFGLDWIVVTDHGGPNHSKLNREQAYPALLASREQYPELIQFWGMEFDTPAAEHTTLMVPHTHDEAEVLFELESQFAAREPWPKSEQHTDESTMIEAIAAAGKMAPAPLFIVNHPGRTATGLQEYTRVEPRELRNWNDTAPHVAVGMAGAPGHQASAVKPFGLSPTGSRGGYRQHPTYGGFDQMTAVVGGFWDSMLGEGRRWWITANSDSHVHWSEGGSDFWPGEYSKTYVYAERSHDGVMEAIREGHVFVTLGDLISELNISAVSDHEAKASIGETLHLEADGQVTLKIQLRHTIEPNANGDQPRVQRVDIVAGNITGANEKRNSSVNPTTRVIARLDQDDWRANGDTVEMTFALPMPQQDMYVRVRGTNTDQLEPASDPQGEDPWQDLWFYANPIFIDVPPHDNLFLHEADHGHGHEH